jgi:hypothetical protein
MRADLSQPNKCPRVAALDRKAFLPNLSLELNVRSSGDQDPKDEGQKNDPKQSLVQAAATGRIAPERPSRPLDRPGRV